MPSLKGLGPFTTLTRPTITRTQSRQGDIVVAQDVSPGWALLVGGVRQDGTRVLTLLAKRCRPRRDSGDLMTCFPSAEPALSGVEGCWATIVTPFGLRIAGSHPFANAGISVGMDEMPHPTKRRLNGAPQVWEGQMLGWATRRHPPYRLCDPAPPKKVITPSKKPKLYHPPLLCTS